MDNGWGCSWAQAGLDFYCGGTFEGAVQENCLVLSAQPIAIYYEYGSEYGSLSSIYDEIAFPSLGSVPLPCPLDE